MLRYQTRWLSLMLCAALLVTAAGMGRADEQPDFAATIAPLLSKHCISCHSGAEPKGNLNLQTRERMLQGGDSGTALVPGSAATSLLYERVASGEMPPEGRPALSAEERQALEQWINAGAPAAADSQVPLPPASSFAITDEHRGHWAFQPLQQVAVPPSSHPEIRTPVDAFIYQRLAAAGLTFSPEADRRTLIRRVYFDLLGLPPTPADLDQFLADDRVDAYERLIDRLLASPHFGERWGRHWLDGAGYADVIGMDNDAGIISTGENKWLYRDYVIDSLNDDKPFSQFLIEQVAGDELVDWRAAASFTADIREKLLATGFLRNSADDTSANELNNPLIQHGVLQRTGEVLVSNLLGLTFNCAKCHDHKYEPIAQRDYYQMLAILQPAFNPQSWLQPAQRQLAELSPAEKTVADQHNQQLDRQVHQLQNQVAQLKAPYETMLATKKLEALPEVIRQDTQMALATVADQRNEIQKYLAEKFEAALKVTSEEIGAALTDADRQKADELQQQINALNGQRRTWGHWQVVYDVASPTPTYILLRGNHEAPGDEVQPGFLQVLCTSPAAPVAAAAPGSSSGRRLALAQWLTDTTKPAGALVLRVRVNRIWQQLFARGLVETADNFGVTGAQPTHPELLEWLAQQFADCGQRHKAFLKMLLMSRAYRQISYQDSSPNSALAAEIDSDNRWLWRMPLRRLESEAIRDAVLASSGQLNRALGGPPVPVEQQADGTFAIALKALPSPSLAWRRSVYLLARRNYHPTVLAVFDQPNMNSNCARRTDSAVVLQSLTLLNDAFLLEQSHSCAAGLLQHHDRHDLPGCIQAAMRAILGRPAEDAEISSCSAMLQRHADYYVSQGVTLDEARQKALAHLCQVLLNTSEFLYIP